MEKEKGHQCIVNKMSDGVGQMQVMKPGYLAVPEACVQSSRKADIRQYQ
jgi:hypothetical protein